MSSVRIAKYLNQGEEFTIDLTDYCEMVSTLKPGARNDRYDNVLIKLIESALIPNTYKCNANTAAQVILSFKLGEHTKAQAIAEANPGISKFLNKESCTFESMVAVIDQLPSKFYLMNEATCQLLEKILDEYAEEKSQFFAAMKAKITLALKVSDYLKAATYIEKLCKEHECSVDYLIDVLKENPQIAIKAELLEGCLNFKVDRGRAFHIFEKYKSNAMLWKANGHNDAADLCKQFENLYKKDMPAIRKEAESFKSEQCNGLRINGRRFGY